MVTFREAIKNNKRYLVVVHRPENTDQTGFKLAVHPPMSGSRSDGLTRDIDKTTQLYRKLRRPHNNSVEYQLCPLANSIEPRTHTFITLGRRIVDGEVQWGTVLKTNGIFNFMERYWEWLEDILSRSKSVLNRTGLYDALSASLFSYSRCPSTIRAFCEAWCPETNTLHTDAGEISISLADLWHIGGLPATGDLYEEVVPSLDELTSSGAHQRARTLPMSCRHLFAAYLHCLGDIVDHENPKVSLSCWVDFWCKRPIVYKKPVPKKRGASRPKDTQNPSGDISEVPRKWSKKDEELFAHLQIEEKSKEESFLAAFIACWLCLFAFPASDATIRPSTFKMASLISHGVTHCLAVPVLANIYGGLNTIARSSAPERGDACLPWHYIIGWIARYFGTHHRVSLPLTGPMMIFYSGEGGAKDINDHDGRDLIHRAHNVSWWASIPKIERTEFKVDDGELSTRDHVFLRSIRSSRLIFHQGGTCFSEPYNPYRFARQFGFFQSVPKELPDDGRYVNVETGRQLWELYFTPKSNLKMVLPESPREYHCHFSSNFGAWWSKVHGTYLLDGRLSLISTVNRGVTKTKQSTPVVKIRNNEPPQPRKEPTLLNPPASSPRFVIRLPSTQVTKGKEVQTDLREKRRADVALVASDSSSHGDVNWKRQKPGAGKQLVLIDPNVNDGSPHSENSTNGPDAFALEADKIRKGHISPISAEKSNIVGSTQPPFKRHNADIDCELNLEATSETETLFIDGDDKLEGRVTVELPFKRSSTIRQDLRSAPLASLHHFQKSQSSSPVL